MNDKLDSGIFDVVVIGGGVAGLSGALTLSRARRSVLVLDAGEPRNAPTAAAHNLSSKLMVPVHSLAVAPQFLAQGDVLAGLGVGPVPHPTGVGTYVPSDPGGATDVPGVWVAGNVADVMAGLAPAQASGATAAAAINADLVNADTDEALARWRAAPREDFSAAIEAQVTERVLSERRHGLDSLLPGTE